jgi:TetR/AcrR family transcriptional regulator
VADESDRRSQILEAAFEQFAAHGFSGATIKGIARAAKLQSQALIYWYFPTKEALFQAVVETHVPVLRLTGDPALLDLPPEELLPLVARAFLAGAANPGVQRLIRLLIPELLRRRELADLVGAQVIRRVLRFLSGYLDRQIALGRLRPHDTRASARAFMGMLLPQAAGAVALPMLREDGLSDEEHIATAIDIFLRGLRPAE